MVYTSNNSDVVFGLGNSRPLRGFPPGRVKIRMRCEDFVQVFIRNAATGSCRAFYVKAVEEFWEPFSECWRNERVVIEPPKVEAWLDPARYRRAIEVAETVEP